MSYVGTLNDSGTRGCLTKSNLSNDSVLFDDCPARCAETIARCSIIFDDSPTAISAYRLGFPVKERIDERFHTHHDSSAAIHSMFVEVPMLQVPGLWR